MFVLVTSSFCLKMFVLRDSTIWNNLSSIILTNVQQLGHPNCHFAKRLTNIHISRLNCWLTFKQCVMDKSREQYDYKMSSFPLPNRRDESLGRRRTRRSRQCRQWPRPPGSRSCQDTAAAPPSARSWSNIILIMEWVGLKQKSIFHFSRKKCLDDFAKTNIFPKMFEKPIFFVLPRSNPGDELTAFTLLNNIITLFSSVASARKLTLR